MRVIFNPSNTGTQFLHLSETLGISVGQISAFKWWRISLCRQWPVLQRLVWLATCKIGMCYWCTDVRHCSGASL